MTGTMAIAVITATIANRTQRMLVLPLEVRSCWAPGAAVDCVMEDGHQMCAFLIWR